MHVPIYQQGNRYPLDLKEFMTRSSMTVQDVQKGNTYPPIFQMEEITINVRFVQAVRQENKY